MSGLNPGTVGAIVSLIIDQSQARRLGIDFSTRKVKFGWFLYLASQQSFLRLSGSPSGQGAGGGARNRDRRVPADLRGDSLATVLPTLREVKKKFSSKLLRVPLCAS
ncbi:hypothetical protein PoB_001831500 [Plakobranchus ocellatus]|uniref:Uncharacterized protein n=1 Tax=Plakobranchus ocellatus TaxID=259542 RepID=A0AAV3ZB77_9GAST|nr:hypothetical protein PoB_001831500 [Plakobranchus ocellatus]